MQTESVTCTSHLRIKLLLGAVNYVVNIDIHRSGNLALFILALHNIVYFSAGPSK